MLTCWGHSGTGGWTCPSLVLLQRRSLRHPSSCSELQKQWSRPPVKQIYFTQHASHYWLKLFNILQTPTRKEQLSKPIMMWVSSGIGVGPRLTLDMSFSILTHKINMIIFTYYNHLSCYSSRLGNTFTMPPVYWATERSTLAAELVPHTGFTPSRYFWAHSTSCSCSMPTPASTMRSGR